MQLPPFLTESADGEIRLTGHRLGLFHLVQRYNEGDSAEMLAAHYPSLPLALVHKALAFYLDNQAEVDAYIASFATAIDERQHGSRRLDLNALRQRLAAQNPSAAGAQAG